MSDTPTSYPRLRSACFDTPAIDNHAHNVCRPDLPLGKVPPFESVFSEAHGPALNQHARKTVAGMKALHQLAEFFHCDHTWEAIEKARSGKDHYRAHAERYTRLFKESKIHGILLDDLLAGVEETGFEYKDHDQWTKAPTKRIVRLETLFERVSVKQAKQLEQEDAGASSSYKLMVSLMAFTAALRAELRNPDVVGFKSVICYRTGLAVNLERDLDLATNDFASFYGDSQSGKGTRLCHKILNDVVLCWALDFFQKSGQETGKYLPVQFHTGLGDNDLTLNLSSPSHLQPLIKAFPKIPFVLLHSSYPYTREAGYLASVYGNVWLDFGEVFPMVSPAGQRKIVEECLELCPGSKLLWSTDGHWFPESFYLASIQSRQVLYEVLSSMVEKQDIIEEEAAQLVEDALFNNSNKLYALGWTR